MRRTKQKPIAMSDEMIESVEKFAAQKHINFSEAVRHLLDESLDAEAARANQSLIRNYIHEEVNFGSCGSATGRIADECRQRLNICGAAATLTRSVRI